MGVGSKEADAICSEKDRKCLKQDSGDRTENLIQILK